MEQDFKKALNIISDWILEYSTQKNNLPVSPKLKFGDIYKQIPKCPPENAESFSTLFTDFKQKILPGLMHWQSNNFFGLFPNTTSPPSILAEMLIATLNVQCMNWTASPAATELEISVMEWLRDLIGLPKEFSGVLQDSASSSTLIATLIAREKATDFFSNLKGTGLAPLVAYCSSEAHFSIEKGIKIAGIGSQNLRKIPTCENQKMNTDILLSTIEEDIKNGFKPFLVVGALGTTGSTAIDDLEKISAITKKYNLWFHIDAAYAGAALILPEIRDIAKGYELADSIVFNPHKWLLTSFECSAFFLKEKNNLVRTFSVKTPEYLKETHFEENTNFSDWSLGLGRRFRALKLWFVIRWYGTDKLREIIRNHILLGQKMENWIANDSEFEILTQRNFNLICFRFRSSDEVNLKIIDHINSSGKFFLGHTKINNQVAIRIVFGQIDIQEDHLQSFWYEIQNIAKKFKKEI
ncbi:pyridoxal phosphate-dependent decarboxylase family protein [Fluviispira vulneris]|uniref:pyridoxal phosphate-dependent decarboxylase family protein n=1 Tax=Fluviispira vulneris TaxID=2763012 RepID=UPI0016468C4E|nr:pyridoxal-dependent decarboxylase [Fluviispira vulneris]